MGEINKTYCGDALEVLKTFPDNFIDCVVTSPPYFVLRDYGADGQLGLESTPEEYVSKMVAVFNEVERVLKSTGTLWLNLGDSYAGSGKGGQSEAKRSKNWQPEYPKLRQNHPDTFKGNKNSLRSYKNGCGPGLKPKDLIGIPWMVAFALRNSGWYLRQDIIWHKPNPMPESVTDRCTKAHEYIFLMSKSARYYYDAEAISEKSVWFEKDARSANGRTPHKTGKSIMDESQYAINGVAYSENGMRNKRSVWTITTNGFPEAHFATFPPELIVDCIKAGCPEDGIVLDPFNGSGTTRIVAEKLGRNSIGIELNPKYIQIESRRRKKELGMFEKVAS